MATSPSRHFYVGPDDDPDKYRLLAAVGRGGEAELWEADMVVAGGRERVAVKILHDDHASDVARWKARWAEQVELLRLVSHPGVVGVHAYFEGARLHRQGGHDPDDRALYMVMNWIDGQDLRDWVPQHTQLADRPLAMRYLAQVAGVLDWLHSGATPSRRAVVHGDISPANVIVDRNGQAVLVDFGLVRVVRHVTAVAAGTRGYTAPEVVRGGEYSPASDRYAFGGLAYYVLTGNHPAEDPRELPAGLAAIAGPGGQPALLDELAAIFATDPAARPSCGDWLRALRLSSSTAPVRMSPLPPLAPGAPSPTPAPPHHVGGVPVSRNMLLGAFGAVVALAALVLALVLIIPDDNDGAGDNTSAGNADGGTSAPRNPPGSAEPSGGQTSAQAQPRQPVKVDLTSLEPVTGTWQTGTVTIEGREYNNVAYTRYDCTWNIVEYALSTRYTRFTATAGFTDTTRDTDPAPFKILVDDKPVLSGSIQLRKPVSIDVDVRGAVRLGIAVELGVDNCGGTVGFADAALERQP